MGDELGNGFGWDRWMRHDNVGQRADTPEWCNVAKEIEIKIVIEGGVDCRRAVDDKERVTVRRRSHDRFGCDVGAAARPVLDDEFRPPDLIDFSMTPNRR